MYASVTEARHKMPTFIQALYGVVIGVTSLKLIPDYTRLSFYKDMPGVKSTIAVGSATVGSLDVGGLLFKFCFLDCTLLIAAHDWYTYHSAKPVKNNQQFWAYVYPINSLFFLAQMLLAASENEMFPWYVAGLGYTLFNALNGQYYLDAPLREAMKKSYRWHILLCLVCLFVLTLVFRNCQQLLWLCYWILLVATMNIVLGIWASRPPVIEEESHPGPAGLPGTTPYYSEDKTCRTHAQIYITAIK